MSRRLIVLLNSMLNSHYVYCYKKICYFFAISRFVFSNYHSLSIILFFLCGGGTGIRTLGRLPFTRFPSVPIRPLSHSTKSLIAKAINLKRLCGSRQPDGTSFKKLKAASFPTWLDSLRNIASDPEPHTLFGDSYPNVYRENDSI